MLYDVYGLRAVYDLSTVLRNGIVRTYGINFVWIVPTQVIERIQKLRQRPLPSNIPLSRWSKDVTNVDVDGLRAMAG
jgi:hypothetical protein